MKFKELDAVVYKNIVELFKCFLNNPAVFWTEADVTSYLYSLLISDPIFKNSLAYFKSENLDKESKTFLVHVNAQDETKCKGKYYDILIMKSRKCIEEESDKDQSAIGIEIKFDRRAPARKERSGILSDIKKANRMHKGYVLWLNWDRKIGPNHLRKAKDRIKTYYPNVKLLYLDMSKDCEIHPRTNVKEIRNTMR